MTVAIPVRTTRGRAVLVEQCNCPPGYKGPSCEVRGHRHDAPTSVMGAVTQQTTASLSAHLSLKLPSRLQQGCFRNEASL